MTDTDKIILVNYPRDFGGKFLINCLGLGDNAVLQCKHLARKQLNGDLNQKDKLGLLISRLNSVKDTWTDLNLGCHQYFGATEIDFLKVDRVENLNLSPVVQQVIDRGWFFFLVCHDNYRLDLLKKYWKNYNCIRLHTSGYKFIKKFNRNKKLHDYWNTVKDKTWPSCPETLEQVLSLPKNILEELSTTFDKTIFSFFTDVSATNIDQKDYIWDTDWYLSESDTIDNVKLLYNKIGITGFDPESIATYRSVYLDTLERLSNARVV